MTIDPRPLRDRLVICPHCGMSVFPMQAATAGGEMLLRDPDHFERRVIRAGMTPAEYAARRWPSGALGSVHFCSGAVLLGSARRGGNHG